MPDMLTRTSYDAASPTGLLKDLVIFTGIWWVPFSTRKAAG